MAKWDRQRVVLLKERLRSSETQIPAIPTKDPKCECHSPNKMWHPHAAMLRLLPGQMLDVLGWYGRRIWLTEMKYGKNYASRSCAYHTAEKMLLIGLGCNATLCKRKAVTYKKKVLQQAWEGGEEIFPMTGHTETLVIFEFQLFGFRFWKFRAIDESPFDRVEI